MSVLNDNVGRTELDQLVKDNEIVLLKFGAPWCGPCKVLDVTLMGLAAEADGFVIGKINVDDEAEIAGEFGVMSVPTTFVLKSGVVMGKAVGTKSLSELKDLVDKAR